MRAPKNIFLVVLLIIAVSFMVNSAGCRQKTILRDGVRLPIEDARRMDIADADAALSEKNYEKAIDVYKMMLDTYPRDKKTSGIMIRLGTAQYQNGNFAAAGNTFDDVINYYPGTKDSAEAAWGISLIAYKDGACNEVLGTLLSYREFASTKRWDQMTMLLAECAKEVGSPKDALIFYADELNEGKDDKLKENAKAHSDVIVKDLSDSELEEIAEERPFTFPGDIVRLELAKRAISRDELDEASRLVKEVGENYPDTAYVPEMDKLRSLLEKWSKVRSNRIGVMLPLSGGLSAQGEMALQGMMLAADVFNKGENFFPAELVIRDTTKGDSTIEEIVEDLYNNEHVVAIVGPMRSSSAKQAAIAAQELGVPIVTLSPTDDLVEAGDMIYQNCLTMKDQAETLADHAVNVDKITRFSVLYPDSAYGRDFLHTFAKSVNNIGGQVIIHHGYEAETTHFRDPIKDIKKYNKSSKKSERIQAIFIPDSWKKVAMIAPQIRYYRLTDIKLFGINAWHSEMILRQTQPDDLEGAIFTDGIAPEAGRPSYNQFRRNYKKLFEHEPGIVAAQAYESVDLLLFLVRTYKIRDREQLKQAIDHVNDFPGVMGLINVEPSGKWRKTVYLLTINDGDILVLY